MASGKSYRAHNGYVDVDDPTDAAWVRKSIAARYGFIDDKIRFHDVADDAPGCQDCGFSAWSWSKACGRCGADLVAQRANPQPIEPVVPVTDLERATAAVVQAEANDALFTPRPKTKVLILLPDHTAYEVGDPREPITTQEA